jgi:hypothetical protein
MEGSIYEGLAFVSACFAHHARRQKALANLPRALSKEEKGLTMTGPRLGKRKVEKFATIAVIVGFLFVAGGVFAHGGDGIIHACLNNSGIPRIVNDPSQCRSNETPLNWGSGNGTVTSVGSGPGLIGGPIESAGTLAHADTTTQLSIDNSAGAVIQDVLLDNFGHVTGLFSSNLDSRYVDVVGDTMTGNLTVDGNTTFGNASSDTVTFNGLVNTSIIPNVSPTSDLGSDTNGWGDVYSRRFIADNSDSFDKFRLYGPNSSFSIGFASGQSLGFLSDWATTFTMSNHASRGWLWRDSSDNVSDGAMSLTTDGRLYLEDTAALMGDVGIGTTAPAEALEVVGNISADKVVYRSARTHYYSVGDGAFFSATGQPFETSRGMGGTFITTPGYGILVAEVHLPDGAVVTEFKAYFVDNAAENFSVSLHRVLNGFATLATVDTGSVTASSALQSLVDSSIDIPIIDNSSGHTYHVRVFSDNWPGTETLRIASAVIEYTISEVE